MLALLLLTWLLAPPALAVLATVFIVLAVTLPSLLTALMDIAQKPTGLPVLTHLTTSVFAMGRPLAQCLFMLVFLPYEACISLDAVARTLVRVH